MLTQNPLCISDPARVFVDGKINLDPNYVNYIKSSVEQFRSPARKNK